MKIIKKLIISIFCKNIVSQYNIIGCVHKKFKAFTQIIIIIIINEIKNGPGQLLMSIFISFSKTKKSP